MPTITEIADLADVPVEGVLRVLNGEAVSEVIAGRVQKAVQALGVPHEAVAREFDSPAPRAQHRVGEVVDEAGSRPVPAHDEGPPAREHLVQTLSSATAELAARLPEELGSVVYEAVRVEVAPVARHMSEMSVLVEALRRVAERIDSTVLSERQARLDDIRLLVDLIVTGWQTVDRRLGRLERKLDRESDGY